MNKLLAILTISIAALALGGCADRAIESRQGTGMDRGGTQTRDPGSPARDAERATALENCVTAVGADRKNCAAK